MKDTNTDKILKVLKDTWNILKEIFLNICKNYKEENYKELSYSLLKLILFSFLILGWILSLISIFKFSIDGNFLFFFFNIITIFFIFILLLFSILFFKISYDIFLEEEMLKTIVALIAIISFHAFLMQNDGIIYVSNFLSLVIFLLTINFLYLFIANMFRTHFKERHQIKEKSFWKRSLYYSVFLFIFIIASFFVVEIVLYLFNKLIV